MSDKNLEMLLELEKLYLRDIRESFSFIKKKNINHKYEVMLKSIFILGINTFVCGTILFIILMNNPHDMTNMEFIASIHAFLGIFITTMGYQLIIYQKCC